MGGGLARETMLKNRNGKKAHAYQRQNKQLREEIARLRDVVDKREHAVAEEARAEIARLSAELLDADARLRDISARAPSIIETIDIRQHGFLRRLWWALGFARTGKMRYERS